MVDYYYAPAMDDATELVYEGPAHLVGALVQMLQEEGLQVSSCEPPMEYKGVNVPDTVEVTLIVAATNSAYGALGRVLVRFRTQWPGAKVHL